LSYKRHISYRTRRITSIRIRRMIQTSHQLRLLSNEPSRLRRFDTNVTSITFTVRWTVTATPYDTNVTSIKSPLANNHLIFKMARKKRVHTIDSNSLTETEPVALPAEKIVPAQVPCTIQALGGGFGGWMLGYSFNIFNFFSLKPRTFRELHRTGMEAGKSLAVCSGIFSLAFCFCSRLRGKEDVWNGVVAGCATGLVTSIHEGPIQAFKQCAIFGGGCLVLEQLGNMFFSEAQALSIYEDASIVRRNFKKKERRKMKLKSIWDSRFQCQGCRSGMKFLPWIG